jgi:hypothetical protein
VLVRERHVFSCQSEIVGRASANNAIAPASRDEL